MRFALALLGLVAVPFTTAVAVPREAHDIAARSPDELGARLLGSLLGGGKDKWDNGHCGWKIDDCSKKGQKCNNKCECEYEHQPQPPKCKDWDRKECEWKKGKFDEHSCKCEIKNDPPKCKDWDRKECEWKKGKFDEHTCKCEVKYEPPKCKDWDRKDCEWKKGKFDEHTCKCTVEEPKCKDKDRKDCEWKHGKFDEHTCKCEVKHEPEPQPPKCKDKDRKECEWKHGKFDEHTCKCEVKYEPPKGEHCPKETQDKCSSKGGKCNDKCQCEKDGGLIDIDIGGGGIKVGIL